MYLTSVFDQYIYSKIFICSAAGSVSSLRTPMRSCRRWASKAELWGPQQGRLLPAVSGAGTACRCRRSHAGDGTSRVLREGDCRKEGLLLSGLGTEVTSNFLAV